jgi:Fe-S-cluster-containing dehydrogenase component
MVDTGYKQSGPPPTTALSAESACTNREKFPSCVGCGYCCTKRVCPFGKADGRGICTSLYWNEVKQMYRCQLAESHHTMAKLLYIGAGCPSNLNTWRRNVRQRF